MRIYLIGMPGSGKSRTGRELAARLNYKLIDTDKEIEERYGSISDIFALKGEEVFRQYEENVLKDTLKIEDVIISCGGGVITHNVNKKILNNGLTIFLNCPLELIKLHLKNSKTRPLLVDNRLEDLYEKRIEKYFDFADFIIDYKDSESSVEKILKIVRGMKMKKILVLNGPNLNMLGLRDKNHYGSLTLEEINKMISSYNCFEYEFYQSNHEGDLVDKLQQYKNYDGIIFNPAAYTHTSVAIHDALEIVDIPVVEVHLSKVNEREEFRRINFISSVVSKTCEGEHELSYIKAINYLKSVLNVL